METQPANVRRAGPQDEQKLYALLVELHRHNRGGWEFPFDPATVLAFIEIGTRPDPKTRTNPNDPRAGLIGVIDGPDGTLLGSVGIFTIPPMWFSHWTVMTELWLYVRPTARKRHLERDLFQFARWGRDALFAAPEMKGTRMPTWLATGFLNMAEPRRFEAMDRLWRRFSGGRKIGSLYRVD